MTPETDMKPDLSTVGLRVRASRKNMSQSDLARMSGLTLSFISRIEGSNRNPSVNSIRKMADALGVSAYWLETGKRDPMEIMEERCMTLMEIARHQRRVARAWRRRAEVLQERLGGDMGDDPPDGLAETLQAELGRLGAPESVLDASRGFRPGEVG